ncbi:MAG: hypothetical protein IT385_31195 [Deltaproteobacteria bacterium]|nr:hypothetical protein [Deltaproteobacteria bacterium]
MAGLMLAGVLASVPVRATTVLKVELPEMTRTSEWVVRARVTAVANVDLRAEGSGLFTDVTLQIEEVYRGKDVPRTYVMRQMGGVGKDGMALTIPGMPRFKPGEEIVVFLEKTSVGHVPCGLGQGVWRVARPPVGPALVRQDARGLNLMARAADGSLAPIHDDGSATTLARLVSDIRAVPVEVAPIAPSSPKPDGVAPTPR